ncbi:hypothetical protein HU200_018544 [Digitaria exilis]|uniref:Knottins-like domain-containing protein n=1 Tax=Digitaria exilis TaxID=1010633 RepID=A0A835F4I5_9POAL|nr:hypothetical protein HU200_018544 [Digitaria exilis]CAB3500275.1 unnamed protein product [Digitaria exilis]CAB3504288.1 unnamed protein product [Digitaria exilis]
MEASHTKLSAAVFLLLPVLAVETGPVQAGECLSKSTTFKGLCFKSSSCNDKCLKESSAYSGGKCRGIYFTCWCITPCAMQLAPEASPPQRARMGDVGGLE